MSPLTCESGERFPEIHLQPRTDHQRVSSKTASDRPHAFPSEDASTLRSRTGTHRAAFHQTWCRGLAGDTPRRASLDSVTPPRRLGVDANSGLLDDTDAIGLIARITSASHCTRLPLRNKTFEFADPPRHRHTSMRWKQRQSFLSKCGCRFFDISFEYRSVSEAIPNFNRTTR